MSAAIAPATRMGTVHLSVGDLARSVVFYEALGLRVQAQTDGDVHLGTGGEALLHLVEVPGARPAHGASGLYHVALLLPERPQLGAFLAHAVRTRLPLTGASDHDVSEALYLHDPDAHGLEVYWDRPREHWEGRVAQRLTSVPLATGDLIATAGGPDAAFAGLPEGTTVGHVHLRVAEVPATIAFYRDILGLELMATFGDQAAFLAAGGYHHHVGANTWESAGAGQAPPGTATLQRAEIVLPDAAAHAQVGERLRAAGLPADDEDGGTVVHDPSGNPLLLRAA